MNAAATLLLRPATASASAAAATRRLDFHRLRLSSFCSCRAFFASSSHLNATQNNDQSPSPSPPTTKTTLLPIGVFIDLDNVAPKTHSRKDVQQFIFPLLQLGRLINQKRLLSPSFNESMSHTKSPVSEIKAVQKATAIQFEAFGNLATRSYVSEQQKEITPFDQEYIPWTPDDELEYGGYAQSGYDPNFDTVRCGICGWKAKLTKKKRTKYKNRGYSDEYEMLEEELMSHMKSLHDNEQKKRIAWMGQNKKKGSKKKRGLKGKELMRYNKYQAAQVGLQRGKMQVSANGKVKIKRRNDLFKVLREIGVRVTSSVNVDADLIASAEKWLSRTIGEHHKNKDVAVVDEDNNNTDEDEDDDVGNRDDDNDDDEQQQLAAMKKESSSGSHPDPIGVLVIYSRDQGFVPLIEHAKRNRFITVSMTNKRTQTSSLIRSSDIIVGQGLFGNWMNEGANGISDDYDEDDDEYGTVDSNDEIDDELDEIERLFRDPDDDIGWDEGGTSFEDLSEESMLDNNDWEESLFDESDLEDEGSADEHDYEIRKLGNAPSWDSLKSLSSSNDNSIHAMSSSDVGLNFMISVQGVQNNDVEGITRWHLADDSVHKNPVKDIDTSMEMKPTTMKQLRREIMPWDSVYSSRGGDRLTEKKDESNQEDVNQEEKTSKKQKKRQKKATKKTKPVTEDEITAAELKRALKIERKRAKKLTKKERKEAAAERRKVEAPKLAAKIARLEGFINNATAKDAKLEDFVYKGTSSNMAVKRMRLKLKNLEAAAKQKERKLRELTE